MIKQSTVT